MAKVGIIGSTGYSGQELVDILCGHPGVELTYLTARFDEKVLYSDVYPKFRKRVDLFCENFNVDTACERCDVFFLALPHTVSMDIVPLLLEKGKKVIDLSADYRLPVDIYEKWYSKKHADETNIGKAVYGLPEFFRDDVKSADIVANPGCYPTGIILGLLPVVKKIKECGSMIVIDSKSGTSGAGRKANVPLSFSEVDEDFKCYKPNSHQHMPEIENILSRAAGDKVDINFTPHLLPIKRGILSTIYVPHEGLPEGTELHKLYEEVYKNEPFVRLRKTGEFPSIQDVACSNYCDIGLKVEKDMLIIVSVIDNLLKGASGQAVQNMNIMCGLDESMGLV